MPTMSSKSKGFLNMVTVGDHQTGKTSLLSILKSGSVPEKSVPEIFETFSLKMKVDGKNVELGLWDTPGGDEYEGLRRLSYPKCDVFIICYSVTSRRSFENVQKKWLPEVRKYCPTSPVIIVGTKQDLRPRTSLQRNGVQGPTATNTTRPKPAERFVHIEEGMEMANEVGAHGFLECSAFAGHGVKEVFEQAARAVLKTAEEKKSKDKSGKKGKK